MNLVRLCSEFSVAAVAATLAIACGSSGSGDAIAPVSATPSAPAASGMTPAATGNDAANAEGMSGDLPLRGNTAANGDMTAANAPINPVASGAVPCGMAGTFCAKPTPTCCTVPGAAGGMGMGANPSSFSCAADIASCPAGTLNAAECSTSAGCGTGEVCCRTPRPAGAMGGGNNGSTAACATTCAAGDTQLCLTDAECGAGNLCNLGNNGTGTCVPAPCTASSCAAGEVCCRGNGGGRGAAPACVAATAGSCPAGRQQVCATAADCPTGSGDTCDAPGGGGGGGVLVCTAPPCTPGSCAGAEQLCCVGGGGGGDPSCVASVAPVAPATLATCPNNQRQFCAVDADCTAVPGTVCLAGGNGGQLSCRQPVCTPTSCAADQLCCVAQGGGALPACVTPAAPAVGAAAACPGSNGNNSRLICESDADCASVLTAIPGATCSAGQNANATLLTCRVPPPPAAPAADAGAGG